MFALSSVKPGQTVKVERLSGGGAVRRRIMDMVIIKGATVLVRKVAPLGDPIEVSVRGCELTLRREEAECVEVSDAGLQGRG